MTNTTAITAEMATTEIARRLAPGRKGSARRNARIATAKRHGTFDLGNAALAALAAQAPAPAPARITRAARTSATTAAQDALAREFTTWITARLTENRDLFV